MKVLIVAKRTNLELYGEKIAKNIKTGFGDNTPMELVQLAHKEHYESLEKLKDELKRHNIEYTEVVRGNYWPKLSTFDAVMTVGGDGTVLEASHRILSESIPLIGVCSSKTSVGFLCLGSSAEIPQIVERLKNSTLEYIHVDRLKAKVHFVLSRGELITQPVLNDFLFSNIFPAATSRYAIKLGSSKELQKSSGIWIATAAGSTAATGAAGGTKVNIEEKKFQYVVRELYVPLGRKPFELTKGFFHPETKPLWIENHCEKAILAIDGQHDQVNLQYGDQIQFLVAPSLKLARFKKVISS